MNVKNIGKIAVDLEALALTKKNINLVSKKKVKTKDLINTGFTNIIGISLLKEQSDFLGSL